MSLSDRLQRARTQQLIEAGVLPDDYVAAPEPAPVLELAPEPEPEAEVDLEETADEGTGLFAPVTIEVPPVGLHLVPDLPDLTDLPDLPEVTVDLTEAPAGAEHDADHDADHEKSDRCPNCNDAGIVDMVDLVGHTVHYTCGTCSTMWHVRKSVIREGLTAS